ncbi:putative xylanase [Paludibacter propionicigenes WB4]|uniref:Putative xylanase n=1 Tax=Paludibacter propionicigenes (strain DSM 17365 / JCM 13257 / WB4) TaxID=694427 RepID=E4T536_PALPW|nr:alpha/beta hydrolase [Paludibacter propionicigenes]ADQ79830.1 putative xylanase [Paludibacter propionicigenes WB4]
MKQLFISVFFLLLFCHALSAQQEIKLYPNGSHESNGITLPETYRDPEFIINTSEPRMYVYPAPKEIASGAAVLICPGGGYVGVAQIKEGSEIAKWFNDLGVTAFVLYYRMPNGHAGLPLADAQTALKIIHKRAKVWNIDKNKIGIMGFSAGGHLASTAGTHFRTKTERPSFMILAYPVVTMSKELTHAGSRENLLGKDPSAELVRQYSNELQVTKRTPPTFIVHAKDDGAVPIANSENLLKALKAKNVPAELHTFDVGGHGFGMRKNGIPADNWPELLKTWLKEKKLIN